MCISTPSMFSPTPIQVPRFTYHLHLSRISAQSRPKCLHFYEKSFGFLSEIISWYREFEFPISGNNSRYQEIISQYQEFEIPISGNVKLFSDIGNSISWYQEIIPDIEKLNPFSDIEKWFPDIGKWFSDIGKSTELPISGNDFPISVNQGHWTAPSTQDLASTTMSWLQSFRPGLSPSAPMQCTHNFRL